MKVAINTDHGRFDLSPKAVARLYELGGNVEWHDIHDLYPNTEEGRRDFADCQADSNWANAVIDGKIVRYGGNAYREPRSRICPKLIQVIEELGQEANGFGSSIKIVEVPDDVDFYIGGDGGIEHVAEKHRCWF